MMIIVIICLLVIICVFASVCLCLFSRIDDANGRIALLEIKTNYLERSEKTIRESVDIQTKCIRDLNDIVKRTVKDKEITEPDTKALISGWDADEAESEDPVKNHIIDICLNGTYEQKQNLIDTMTLQSVLLGQMQQCIYPWPLQSGQFQSCSMLPLWYVNRRLENM